MLAGSEALPADLPPSVLGHQFKDTTLFQAALTHPSSTDSSQGALRIRYQRLEFLGDAVWSFYVSEALVSLCPNASEGELTIRRTRLISAAALAEMASRHEIAPLIRLSKGEESNGARQRSSILSSVFEAVIGAIYLDGGGEEIQRIAHQACSRSVGGTEVAADPKTALQQFTQSRFHAAPHYRLLRRSGPPHAPTFEIEVLVGQSPIGRGSGPSRKQAEQEAALRALAWLSPLSTRSCGDS